MSWYYSLESLSNQLPLDTHYLWGDYKPVSKVQSCKVCQAGAMITPLQKLLHLSTVENGKKYNIVMTWAPKEAESTLSMLEHMISIQIQSSEAPLLPFLMPCSQASMCITRNQPLCLQSPNRWCFREVLGCRHMTQTGHLRFSLVHFLKSFNIPLSGWERCPGCQGD